MFAKLDYCKNDSFIILRKMYMRLKQMWGESWISHLSLHNIIRPALFIWRYV